MELRPDAPVYCAVEIQTTTNVPVQFHTGNILQATTRVLVSTANPGFQLTGGIGAALMISGGAGFQAELNRLARARFGTRPAPRGSLLLSSGAGLPFDAIVHVVAIDVFYKTTDDVIAGCMLDALLQADRLGVRSVAVPAFATGYGRHPLVACGSAMKRGYAMAQPRLANLRLIELWMRDEYRLAEFSKGWCAA